MTEPLTKDEAVEIMSAMNANIGEFAEQTKVLLDLAINDPATVQPGSLLHATQLVAEGYRRFTAAFIASVMRLEEIEAERISHSQEKN